MCVCVCVCVSVCVYVCVCVFEDIGGGNEKKRVVAGYLSVAYAKLGCCLVLFWFILCVG